MGKNQQGEQVQVGVAFTGLFKCEEDTCGCLFIREVPYLFQIPGAEPKEQPPKSVQIMCPHNHSKVKFVQSIDKTPMTVIEDADHGER